MPAPDGLLGVLGALPIRSAVSAVVGIAVAIGIVYACVRRPRGRPEVAVALALLLALVTVAVAPVAEHRPLVLLGAGVVLLAWSALWIGRLEETTHPPQAPSRWLAVQAVAVVAISAWLILDDLGTSPALPMVWEPEVFLGFEASLRDGLSPRQFLHARFSWGWGLVSSSWDTLVYGTTTYAVFLAGEVSLLGQRLPAAILALGCIPAAGLAGWQLGGRRPALFAAMVATSHPAVAFYGRYGAALSATALSLLVAVATCLKVVDSRRLPWWAGVAAGLSLALATFAYAPARATVVAVGVVTFGCLVFRGWTRDRLVAAGFMAAIAMGLCVLEWHRGEVFRFAHGRGEQLWSMMRQPYLVSMHLDLPDSRDFSHSEIAVRLARRTLPQAAEVLTLPVHPDLGPRNIVLRDPPWLPLLAAPLIPFALIGCAACLRHAARPANLILWAVCASALPMILTTRIDAYRLVPLVVPACLFSAQGLATVASLAARHGTPRWLPALASAVLFFALLAHSAVLVRTPLTDPGPLPELVDVVDAVPEGVVIVMDADHRITGGVRMAATRRWLNTARCWSGRVADPDLAAQLADGDASAGEPDIGAVAAGDTTLVVYPRQRYTALERRLEHLGFDIEPFAAGSQTGFTARPPL